MEILKLLPVGKETLWGGTRLKKEYGKDFPMDKLGETWECSVHPDGMSLVANGQYRNQTLGSVLQQHPEYLGSKIPGGKDFPILVKFIDANQDLSVQVHPDDEYAQQHGLPNGKTEMWYIMDAVPDAEIIYGFEHQVDKEKLAQAVVAGNLDKHLHKVKVQKGESYFVPAGTVHGIGAGVLVAEIQQSSNETYRVYDYNRQDAQGHTRELHFDKAVATLDMSPISRNSHSQRLVKYYPNCSREILCACEYFVTEKIVTKYGFSFPMLTTSFQVVLCLEGEGTLEINTEDFKPVPFNKGDCLFIPAGKGKCCLFGAATLLKIRC